MSRRHFTYAALDDLREDVDRRGLDMRFEETLSRIGCPVAVAGRRIGNALGIHPMEGCDGTRDGAPGELTLRRWHRFATGGAKLLWGEATAVVAEGRANPRQLWIHEGNLDAFENLVASTRACHRERFGTDTDFLVGLQLTHSGRYSYTEPLLARSDSYPFQPTDRAGDAEVTDGKKQRVVTDSYLEHLEDAFVRAASFAAKVGFDFVDIKQCHGYLLNELLGARDRKGRYGGSFENRTRFVRNVLLKINDAPDRIPLLASRISAYDGVPFVIDRATGKGKPVEFDLPYDRGFGIDRSNPLRPDRSEPLLLTRLLSDHGVRLVNVSLGNPYENPHIGRPYERPARGHYHAPEHPLEGLERHFKAATVIQEAFPDLCVVGTGYSWLRQFSMNAAESNLRSGKVKVVALGRGALAYPSFAEDALSKGTLDRKRVCLSVSFCTDLMRSKENELGQVPAGCVPRDRLYAEIYRDTRQEAKKLP